MSQLAHIVSYTDHLLERAGLARPTAYCGQVLEFDEGSDYDAPLCPLCMRRAGWTYDKRQDWA